MSINTVTVIGVTGTMGANIAGIFASFDDAKVYCVGRNIEKVKRTIPRIVKSVKADAIAKNLIPADFSMLESCVAEFDLIFESSKEDINVKIEIADRVGRSMKNTAISGTGSSGLSINTIAEHYPEKIRSRPRSWRVKMKKMSPSRIRRRLTIWLHRQSVNVRKRRRFSRKCNPRSRTLMHASKPARM